jgi:hypothetical protein
MDKDKRYKTVKILIETANVTTFAGIFEHIPKTTVADDLGIHFNRMVRMIENVNEIKVSDIFLFSTYFDIDAKVLFDLIYNQHIPKKPSGKAKSK